MFFKSDADRVPCGSVVRIWHFHWGGTGSTPGQGSILYATKCGQNTGNKKKERKVKQESGKRLNAGFVRRQLGSQISFCFQTAVITWIR